MALLVALGEAVLALTRDDGDGDRGARAGGAGAITDDIVAGARPGTIYIESKGFGQRAAGTGVLWMPRRGSCHELPRGLTQ